MSLEKNNVPAPQPSFNGGNTARTYLALGDSYTIGHSVAESARFPVQTVSLLRQQHINMKDPVIVATSGWTTANLLSALEQQTPADNYTVVSLLIGVNNQYQRRRLGEYQTEFAQLLSKAISFAGGDHRHVFVLSIADYSVTPFAAGTATAQIAEEIDQFNATCRHLSLEAGVHYIDITAISRAAEYNLHLVADDGLHPSALQYEKWSALLASAMLPELQ